MSVRKPSGITLKGLNISKGAGKLVRRKVDVRTVCIALEVDADASEKMHQTRRLYGQACNLLVPIVVSDTDRKKRALQGYLWVTGTPISLEYPSLRGGFGWHDISWKHHFQV